MNSSTKFAADVRAALPEPGTTPIEHLRHVVAAFEICPDEELVKMATYNVYGDGVTTGLTWGDLRALLAQLES